MTAASFRDLLRVLLLDAAHLQEEEAENANRFGYSKHKPALPLYTRQDALASLELVQGRNYGEPFAVTDGVAVMLRRTGHILGSASIELRLGQNDPFCLVFSGDLGRWNRPILRDPEFVEEADVLLVESTYGNRTHPPDPAEHLARIVREAAERGGALLVPAFAVGRAQELIWTLRQLEEASCIPALPVYIDSPMAINVSDIYCRHPEDHDLDMKLLMDEKRCPLCCKQYNLVRTPHESRSLKPLTAVGTVPVLFFRTAPRRLMDGMMGLAGGIMIAAACWSLLQPALEMEGVAPASIGLLGGAAIIYLADQLLPHLHPEFPQEATPEGPSVQWRRSTLLMLAITLHNFPEGLAVGVAYGAENLSAATALAIGIGLQNIPEALAIALPLRRDGMNRWKAFWYGQLSAAIEPIAGVLGAAVVQAARPLLPYAMSAAAGAMIYVVIEELIPETVRSGTIDVATLGFIGGFTLMMALDNAMG